MRSLFLMLLGLGVLVLSPFRVTFSERCHPQDKKVLLQFKKELNNPYFLASWDPKVDCCDWYCVKCDEQTNRIYDVFLKSSVPDPEISGQIPPSVGDLPYLEYLTSTTSPTSLAQFSPPSPNSPN